MKTIRFHFLAAPLVGLLPTAMAQARLAPTRVLEFNSNLYTFHDIHMTAPGELVYSWGEEGAGKTRHLQTRLGSSPVSIASLPAPINYLPANAGVYFKSKTAQGATVMVYRTAFASNGGTGYGHLSNMPATMSPGIINPDVVRTGGRLYLIENGDLCAVGTTVNSFAVVKELVSTADLEAAGKYVYFCGDNGTSGKELWRSDGTAAGTALLKDIFPGSGSSAPQGLASLGTRIYFGAADALGGENHEPWYSDGTTAGTKKLRELRTGEKGSRPKEFTSAMNMVFFTADDGVHGRELYVTNGSAIGTTLLKDIHTTSSSNPHLLTSYAGVIYFFATDNDGREKLFACTGGTPDLTMPKITIPQGSVATAAMAYGNKLFYVTSSSTSRQLWAYTPAAGTSVPVAPDVASNLLPIAAVPDWAVVDNFLYFPADFDGNGQDLWKVSCD